MNSPSPKRRNTASRYVERINLALHFIQANLDRTISLKEVAEISRFSIFHFHRIFHAMTGETVNEYVNRKRLERAANLLIFKRKLSITEVASDTGFSSSANFAKSFKLYFGVSPSEMRRPGTAENSKIGKIYSKYGKAFDPNDLYPPVVTHVANHTRNLFEDMDMNITVSELNEQIACALASPDGYEAASLFNTWDRLIDWASYNGFEATKQKRFALCYDNPAVTPLNKCRYEASILVTPDTSVANPFLKRVIPAGKYAVAYFKGAPEETTKFHISLYSSWLPSSGFEPDNFPLMEHYLNDVREDGYVEMEVYIKLKSVT